MFSKLCVVVLVTMVANHADALLVPFRRGEVSSSRSQQDLDVAQLDKMYDWNNNPTYRDTHMRLEKKGTRANCTEKWFTVPTNHFEYVQPLLKGAPETFQMRYYECMDENWKDGDTIFYYTGNEAPIEFFMNWSGLLWENAKQFGAKLVWAEHRYFGKSRPWMNESMPKGDKLRYLTPDQALADYAAHINYLRYEKGAAKSAIIGFGGSYGGLLCGWMRGKYPYALDGCIASSAPIGMFAGVHPAFNKGHGAEIVTKDATAARGAAANCSDNIRRGFEIMAKWQTDATKLAKLSSIFQTCSPLGSETDGAEVLMEWARAGLIAMAQNSFPYPSNLMLLGAPGIMPAYPLRAACSHVGGRTFDSDEDLLKAFAAGMQVYFNASNTSSCTDVTQIFPPSPTGEALVYLWEYLACTSILEQWDSNGKTDMFFYAPINMTAKIASCRALYGDDLEPQPEWVQLQYGGRSLAQWGSNIVFSNGGYDPIRAGGVVNNTNLASTNFAVVCPAYGHMGDLAFSNPADTEDMITTRQMEVEQIAGWVNAVGLKNKG